MQPDQLLEEIREANLAYLMLAQHMIRADRPQALYRLGLSEEVANLIGNLTPGQIMKIAAGNMLMCRFRFDDEIVWNLLTTNGKVDNTNGLHANILMAGRMAEAA
jgi:flagellar transcriptional activator FlhD